MKVKAVIDKYPNFKVWPTGGGCEAYGLSLDDGGCILITEVDDPSLPEPDAEFVSIGLIDSEGEEVEGVSPCPVNQLEETINRMIAKGTSGKPKLRSSHPII